MRRSLILIALLFALLGAACSSDENPGFVVGTVVPEVLETSGDVERWWIDAEHVDCVGVFEQTCLVVREGSEEAERTWFYDSIDGLDVQEGTAYVVDVRLTPVDDPPADASSLRYELVELISSN